jgi:hypothetical protein
MLNRQPHVIDHIDATKPAWRIGGAEIAVNIMDREPCVFKSAFGTLSMELCERFILYLSRRMLKYPGYIRLASYAHCLAVSTIILSDLIMGSVFYQSMVLYHSSHH